MLNKVSQFTNAEFTFIVMNKDGYNEADLVAWIMYHRCAPLHIKQFEHYDELVKVKLLDLKNMDDSLTKLRQWLDDEDTCSDKCKNYCYRITLFIGRTNQDADWQQELDRIALSYTKQRTDIGRGYYFKWFKHATNELLASVIGNLEQRAFMSPSEWWSKRVASTPSGSTIWKSAADKSEQDELRSTDRANKRVAYAHLPDNAYDILLSRTPHITARCSTKHEPGRKNRALYAACDCSTVIASYASYGIEDASRVRGMVMRQKPEDLAQWIDLHECGQTIGGFWASLDYTDFNKEHRWWEQAYINCTLMNLTRQNLTHTNTKSLAAAHAWVALSYTRRTVNIGKETTRVHSGLFSGERNTARDNTFLHDIYQSMVNHIIYDLLEYDATPVKSFKSGDDEDTLFTSEEQFRVVYAMTTALGWHLNPTKQLKNGKKHEFLRYMLVPNAPPIKAPAPMIINTAYKSWYKTATDNLIETPESMMRQLATTIRRGAHNATLTKINTHIINTTFRSAYGTFVDWTPLLSDTSRKLLNMSLDLPSVATDEANEQVVKILRNVNPIGFVQYCQRLWPLLETVPEGHRNSIMDKIRDDTFGSWFNTYKSKHKRQPELPVVGKPIEFPDMNIIIDHNAEQTLRIHRPMYTDNTDAAVASRMGIPLPLFKALDYLELIKSGMILESAAMATVDKSEKYTPLPESSGLLDYELPWCE